MSHINESFFVDHFHEALEAGAIQPFFQPVYRSLTGRINAVSREGGKTGVAESDVATVTVNKAAPTVTAPTAKTLTYNGSAQELVNAGSTKDGTIQYAIGSKDAATESYKTDIPKGTEVGT